MPPLAGGGAGGGGESSSTSNMLKEVLKSANAGSDSSLMRGHQRTTSAYNMAQVVSSNGQPSTSVAVPNSTRKLSIKPERYGSRSPSISPPYSSHSPEGGDAKVDSQSHDMTPLGDRAPGNLLNAVSNQSSLVTEKQQQKQQQSPVHHINGGTKGKSLPPQLTTEPLPTIPVVKTCHVTVMVTDRGGAMSKKELESLFLTVLTVRPEQQQQHMHQRNGAGGVGGGAMHNHSNNNNSNSNKNSQAVEQEQDPQSNRGSGLGLALAKEIIVLHHGDVLARSSEGGGNTIGFRIPFEVVAAAAGDDPDQWPMGKPFQQASASISNRHDQRLQPNGQGQEQGQPLANSRLLLAPQQSTTGTRAPLQMSVPARLPLLPQDLAVRALDEGSGSEKYDRDMPTNSAGNFVDAKAGEPLTQNQTTTATTATATTLNNLSNIAGGGGIGNGSQSDPAHHNFNSMHRGSMTQGEGATAGVTTLVISNRANAEFSNPPSPNISPSPSLNENLYTAAQDSLDAFEGDEDDGDFGGGGPTTTMTSASSTPLISMTTPFTPRTLGFSPLLRIAESPSMSRGPGSASSALLTSSSPPNEIEPGSLRPSNQQSNVSDPNIAHSNASVIGHPSVTAEIANAQRYYKTLLQHTF